MQLTFDKLDKIIAGGGGDLNGTTIGDKGSLKLFFT
jgi:hypothetical protein